MSEQDTSDISAVLDTYALGIDTKDWDLVASVFTDHAELDYTAFGGPRGPAGEVIEWLRASLSTFAFSQHHITNRHIDIDGDEAQCRSDLFAPMGMDADEGKMTMLFTGGCYLDTFQRFPDGWRIRRRVCDQGWIATGPKASGPRGPG